MTRVFNLFALFSVFAALVMGDDVVQRRNRADDVLLVSIESITPTINRHLWNNQNNQNNNNNNNNDDDGCNFDYVVTARVNAIGRQDFLYFSVAVGDLIQFHSYYYDNTLPGCNNPWAQNDSPQRLTTDWCGFVYLSLPNRNQNTFQLAAGGHSLVRQSSVMCADSNAQATYSGSIKHAADGQPDNNGRRFLRAAATMFRP